MTEMDILAFNLNTSVPRQRVTRAIPNASQTRVSITFVVPTIALVLATVGNPDITSPVVQAISVFMLALAFVSFLQAKQVTVEENRFLFRPGTPNSVDRLTSILAPADLSRPLKSTNVSPINIIDEREVALAKRDTFHVLYPNLDRSKSQWLPT